MSTFNRKDNVNRKLGSGESLQVHTGIRLKKKKISPKPLSWWQRLIGVVIDWMVKRG